jgi:hypothetical protein
MAHPTDLTGHGGGRSHADGAAERGTGPSPLGGLLGRVPRLDRLRTGAEADRPQAGAGFAGGLDLLTGCGRSRGRCSRSVAGCGRPRECEASPNSSWRCSRR